MILTLIIAAVISLSTLAITLIMLMGAIFLIVNILEFAAEKGREHRYLRLMRKESVIAETWLPLNGIKLYASFIDESDNLYYVLGQNGQFSLYSGKDLVEEYDKLWFKLFPKSAMIAFNNTKPLFSKYKSSVLTEEQLLEVFLNLEWPDNKHIIRILKKLDACEMGRLLLEL